MPDASKKSWPAAAFSGRKLHLASCNVHLARSVSCIDSKKRTVENQLFTKGIVENQPLKKGTVENQSLIKGTVETSMFENGNR